jgi:hypothetical protein
LSLVNSKKIYSCFNLKEVNNLKKVLSYVSIGIFVILAIPFILDRLISYFNFNNIGSNETWLNFWGVYLGAILGGACTLTGVLIANRFQKAENQEKYRMDNRVIVQVEHLYNLPLKIYDVYKHRPARILFNPEYEYAKNLPDDQVSELNFLSIHNPSEHLVTDCQIALKIRVLNNEEEVYSFTVDAFIPTLFSNEKVYILVDDLEKRSNYYHKNGNSPEIDLRGVFINDITYHTVANEIIKLITELDKHKETCFITYKGMTTELYSKELVSSEWIYPLD